MQKYIRFYSLAKIYFKFVQPVTLYTPYGKKIKITDNMIQRLLNKKQKTIDELIIESIYFR